MIAHKRSTYRGKPGWLIYGSRKPGWRVRVFVADTDDLPVETVLTNVKAGRPAFERSAA